MAHEQWLPSGSDMAESREGTVSAPKQFTVITYDASGNRRASHDYDDVMEAYAAAQDDSEGSHTSCVVESGEGIARVYINGEAKLTSTF